MRKVRYKCYVVALIAVGGRPDGMKKSERIGKENWKRKSSIS
jgi:hypothetical protein